MSTMQIAVRDLAFNKQRLLANFDDWSMSVAEALAEDEDLVLSEYHWKIIYFLRKYYGTHTMPPSPRVIIKAIGTELSAHAPCTRKYLEGLFPNGGCKQACRISGLPRYYCHSC